MDNVVFSIFISTYNRVEDIKYSLKRLEPILDRDDVECLICDDASSDGTYDFIKANYPKIKLFLNEKHKGYIFSRNFLLRQVKGQFAISMDDDLNFLSQNVLETIRSHFELHPKCAVQGYRVYWGKDEPESEISDLEPMKVRSFVGCAHAFRMKAWKQIPEYPEWFIFYGEENFASYQFFKKGWEIHYVPAVLCHHRVDMKARKKQSKDFIKRQRRAIRAGWYLYFLFLPYRYAFKHWASSIWNQLRRYVFKGDFRTALALLIAIVDMIRNLPRLIAERNRLTIDEYHTYYKIPAIPVFWSPKSLNNKA